MASEKNSTYDMEWMPFRVQEFHPSEERFGNVIAYSSNVLVAKAAMREAARQSPDHVFIVRQGIQTRFRSDRG